MSICVGCGCHMMYRMQSEMSARAALLSYSVGQPAPGLDWRDKVDGPGCKLQLLMLYNRSNCPHCKRWCDERNTISFECACFVLLSGRRKAHIGLTYYLIDFFVCFIHMCCKRTGYEMFMMAEATINVCQWMNGGPQIKAEHRFVSSKRLSSSFGMREHKMQSITMSLIQ